METKKHKRKMERGNKDKTKKQNENIMSNGVDETIKTWNVDRDDRNKRKKQKQMANRECF